MARSSRIVVKASDRAATPVIPAMTPEDQEDQLISLAMDLAVKRLKDGTASNQLVSEIIKLGTQRERLAREKLQKENELLKAKTEAIEAQKKNGELYSEAIRAMGIYSGTLSEDDEEDNEYEDY